MFSFITGLFGNYKGYQQDAPRVAIVDNTQPATVDNIMQIPGVWQCVNKICNSLATLPCDVLKLREGDRLEVDKDCHLAFLLSKSPNASMTPYDFFRAMTLNYVLNGNGYARISYAVGGNYVASITPLNAEQVKVKRLDANNVIYEFYNEDNTIELIKPENMLHWKNIGNGTIGLSLKEFARATLTEASCAQSASNESFTKNGRMAGILTSDKILTNQQKNEIAKQFNAMRNTLQIGVIPADLRFQQLNLSPSDIQLLETREFIVKEFARWFGIPFGLLSGEASNLDELNNYFYKSTILPMCTGLEQCIMDKIACAEGKDHIVKFRLSFLNRASDAQRAALNATYVQNGIKSRNEVRREEGLRDVAGGELFTAQTNLAPLDMLGQYDPTQTSQTNLTTQPQKN